MLCVADLDVGVGVQRLVGALNPLDFHRSFVSRNKPVLVAGLLAALAFCDMQRGSCPGIAQSLGFHAQLLLW